LDVPSPPRGSDRGEDPEEAPTAMRIPLAARPLAFRLHAFRLLAARPLAFRLHAFRLLGFRLLGFRLRPPAPIAFRLQPLVSLAGSAFAFLLIFGWRW
jgi:hypothetical protein